MPIRNLASAAPILLALGLAACSGSGGSRDDDGTGGGGGNGGQGPSTATRYALANGCFALQSRTTGAHAVRNADGSYAVSSPAASGGEPLYLKPTALGEYLLYASDRSLLSANGSSVGSTAAPSDATVWTVDRNPSGVFTLVNEAAGQALATDANGRLVLADAPGAFGFATTSGCAIYPEISTDSLGDTYKGRGIDKPVVGFAEVHTHMAMGHEMSDGSHTVGPSAGGAMYGQMFHRFGVPHALKDCAEWHGPNGIRDPEAAILDMNPGGQHDNQGWPTFIDWPAYDSQLHQAMYYKWVERAWKSGLRIMVSEGTNIEALCEIARIYMTTVRPEAQSYDCQDMSLGLKQVEYLYELQDYVDAQEGGPGQGWFRIVKDPFEARRVINDGKLAVIAGLEFSNIFECKLRHDPLGNEIPSCTRESIDQWIDTIWDMGVREVFPYHDVNSTLGGTGIFDGLALNLVGFYGTGRFWETEDCPDVEYFAPGIANYLAGAVMTTAIPGTGSDPITQAIIPLLQGTLPVYKPGVRQCNRRGMTELGEYAMQRLMEKRFIIDIDHASLKAKQKMLDLANAQSPRYPLVSAHGGHGGITLEMARNILRNRGLIYPFKPNGKGHVEFLEVLKPVWNESRPGEPIAIGFGMDANGIADRAPPRGAGSEPVQYPFTLFQGEDWRDPMFAGIRPITFKLQTHPESGKFWHIDEVGTAHYGMTADYVEEIRLEGGTEALKALYQSAEAYLQMWERVVCRGADKPAACQ
jgi:hypothetical protein